MLLWDVKYLPWPKYCNLLSLLNDRTPFGNIIAIRSEKDPKVLKHYTPDQKAERLRWQRKQASKISKEEALAAMKIMEQAIVQAFK